MKPYYNYRATVLDHIDGDTFDFDVDYGFTVRQKHRFRLLGSQAVNTPELRSPDPAVRAAARAALARVKELIPVGDKVIILTRTDSRGSDSADGFGRYLAQVIMANGTNLGDILLAEGHATVWTR